MDIKLPLVPKAQIIQKCPSMYIKISNTSECAVMWLCLDTRNEGAPTTHKERVGNIIVTKTSKRT